MFSRLSASVINIAALTLTAASLLAGAEQARAASQVVARVDLSEQRMQVIVAGRTAFTWKVSTAGRGYVTPTGSFRPVRMEEMWYSRKYDNSPMPHAIFFHGGYAVHATEAVKRLGTPASHGCVRLHPDDASDFYQLVEAFGPQNTRIVIVE